jgi:type IV secretion system protein VirD4
MERLADRELSGLLSTASRALRLFTDPIVARNTATSDFSLGDVRSRPQPFTLYLSVPFGDQERCRPLTRLVIRQLLDHCTQHRQGWVQRMLFMVDEVPTLKRLQVLADGLDFLAGYGVRLALITPSLHGLDRLYGPHNNFLEGCSLRIAFAPNDADIAERFSRLTGMMEREKERVMVAREPLRLLRDRTTTSVESRAEPPLPATALIRLAPDQLLLLVGNHPPAIVSKARY